MGAKWVLHAYHRVLHAYQIDHAFAGWQELAQSWVLMLCYANRGGHVVTDAPRRNKLYLPGSFNPLHAALKVNGAELDPHRPSPKQPKRIRALPTRHHLCQLVLALYDGHACRPQATLGRDLCLSVNFACHACTHAGHKQLLAVARSLSGDKEAAFELSIGNPDKPQDRLQVTKANEGFHPKVTDCLPKDRNGKGYIAVPAYMGSLAEAKDACDQTSPIWRTSAKH
eukprot:1156877-Pelagomonas_calceolata.AAC.5